MPQLPSGSRLSSADLQDEEIVRQVKRVLTYGHDAFHLLERNYEKVFYQRNWLIRWDTTSPPSAHHHHSFSSVSTPIEHLHASIAARLNANAGDFKKDYKIGINRPSIYDGSGNVDQGKIDEILEDRIRTEKPFVDGQIINFKGRTTFPINLLNLRGQTGARVYPITFGLPLEHGFCIKSLKDYYEGASLLRLWNCYSDLSVVTIPSDTYVNCRVGLIAPKAFPKVTDLLYHDSKLEAVSDDKDDLVSVSTTFTYGATKETHQGGNIQFMIGFAERYAVYDYGSICKDASGAKKVYIAKENDRWRRPQDEGEFSHFLDSEYLETPFLLEDILRQMGVLKAEEHEKIKVFLNGGVRESLSIS